jgi:hypothetical protein
MSMHMWWCGGLWGRERWKRADRFPCKASGGVGTVFMGSRKRGALDGDIREWRWNCIPRPSAWIGPPQPLRRTCGLLRIIAQIGVEEGLVLYSRWRRRIQGPSRGWNHMEPLRTPACKPGHYAKLVCKDSRCLLLRLEMAAMLHSDLFRRVMKGLRCPKANGPTASNLGDCCSCMTKTTERSE